MKTRFWNFFPILLSLAISSFATPRYYTFEGTVTASNNAPFSVGNPVSYTFLLDFDVTTVTYIDNGTTYALATTPINNYWLAQFISGSIVSVPSGGSFYYDIGSDYLTENRSFVQGNIASTNYNFIQIEIASKKGIDWVVGDHFLGKNDGFYGPGLTGLRFTVLSNLTLTAINSTPVADAGENISITSSQVASTSLVGLCTDQDAGDTPQFRWLEGSITLLDWTPVAADGICLLSLAGHSFTLGQHTLTLEVFDGSKTASDDMLLVLENTTPTAAGFGGGAFDINETISLRGEVSDFDGDIVHYKWTVDTESSCFGDLQTLGGGDPVSLTPCPVTGLDLGMHTATLEASDGVNPMISSQVQIEIVDNTKPTLAPLANKNILWPPNHQMVNVAINAHAADNSGVVQLSASVSSNEPIEGLGDGDTAPDWTEPVIDVATGTISLQLRSERSGKGNGRIYFILVAAADPSGNTASSTVEVKVPHSQGKK